MPGRHDDRGVDLRTTTAWMSHDHLAQDARPSRVGLDARTERPVPTPRSRWWWCADSRTSRIPVPVSARTQDGGYQLDVPRQGAYPTTGMWMEVGAPGLATEHVEGPLDDILDREVVRLSPAPALEVVALRADGAPRPHATVSLAYGGHDAIQTRVTDAQGRTAFGDLPSIWRCSSSYTVRTWRPQRVRHGWWLEAGAQRTIHMGGSHHAGAAARVAVRGQPISDAAVNLRREDDWHIKVFTARNGTWRADGLQPGGHEVLIALDEPEVTLRRTRRDHRG